MGKKGKCCCCIPLKAGVIIISTIWLIYGIYTVIYNVIYLSTSFKDSNYATSYRKIKGYTFFTTVGYAFVAIGAAFGLYVVNRSNTPKMLSIYSKIAYVIGGIIILDHIVSSVFVIVNRPATKEGNIKVPATVGHSVIVFLVTLYFATEISSYARKRKDEEFAKNQNDIDQTDNA